MKQTTKWYLLLFMLIFLSCAQNKKEQGVSEYKMKDYLEVAEYFEEADKVYQTTGVATFPYIIEMRKGNKQLTFVGTAHTRDITHQADSMEQAFYRLKPQIAFNEGGQVDAGKTYSNRDEAIIEDGETGHLKYLSDSLGIEVLNGDLDLATEVHALFEKHDRKNVLLYLANERFFDLYTKNWIDTTAGLENAYQTEFIDYLQSGGVKLREEEKVYSYMQQAYQDNFDDDLNIYSIPTEKFYFLNDGGELTEIGRSSKVVRDIHLLRKVEEAFKTYDRVFVVFGGAHAVAVEPALHQIMEKQGAN